VRAEEECLAGSGHPGFAAAAFATTRLEQLERARNQADGAAFGELFAPDTDFVDIRGGHHRGDAAVGQGHQALFDSIYAGSTIRYELDAARVVAPGCVVAVATATLNTPSGPAQGVNRSRLTMAITEDRGRWSLAAFHNTLVQQGACTKARPGPSAGVIREQAARQRARMTIGPRDGHESRSRHRAGGASRRICRSARLTCRCGSGPRILVIQRWAAP
jgi:uncharacterized protein (TIGR02246 family)